VEGDENVANNSRWVEFVYHPVTQTFTYVGPSSGTPNFRTIPGLVDPGAAVTSASTDTQPGQPITTAIVTFNRSMDPSTFTPNKVTFTGPNGAITITGVTPVAGSHNSQFAVSFAQQSALGVYTMVIGPDIHDTFGNPMAQAYTAQFTIDG